MAFSYKGTKNVLARIAVSLIYLISGVAQIGATIQAGGFSTFNGLLPLLTGILFTVSGVLG